MATQSSGNPWNGLRLFLAAQTPADVSDRELLDRFLRRQDEAAFAALVHRHGAMVVSACRRVLNQEQDAEDACQATFLILAHKAAAIRKRRSPAPGRECLATPPAGTTCEWKRKAGRKEQGKEAAGVGTGRGATRRGGVRCAGAAVRDAGRHDRDQCRHVILAPAQRREGERRRA
jgi:hypothetical protein